MEEMHQSELPMPQVPEVFQQHIHFQYEEQEL